ncbi:MAG: glycosyltransferase family 2 protein [Imperialibacter sp.]|uniref:glycosyltransferase family 2 protein n=1 Tax=Imperialibacter sp. TaxID=2038411 RepID=UPI0030DC823A
MKGSKARISIVTPSFNQGQYLEQTICSVLDQNYPQLEYMIFDGGSTDGSVAIIKKYQKYLSYWESSPDRGQSHAINKGLSRATGEVFNWLNSDDHLEPGALKSIERCFENPATKVVCGRSRIFRDSDQTIKYSSGTDVYLNNLAKTIGWARIDQPETFFRLQSYRTVGPLNESLHYLMDKEWWMRYLCEFGLDGIVSIPDTLVNFRHHSLSKTVSQQNGFEEEVLLVISSFANSCNYPNTFKFFEDQKPSINYSFKTVDQKLLEASVSYMLLLLSDYYYYQKMDNSRAKLFLQGVIEKHLETEDTLLFRRLKVRTRFLPPFLRKIYRTLK